MCRRNQWQAMNHFELPTFVSLRSAPAWPRRRARERSPCNSGQPVAQLRGHSRGNRLCSAIYNSVSLRGLPSWMRHEWWRVTHTPDSWLSIDKARERERERERERVEIDSRNHIWSFSVRNFSADSMHVYGFIYTGWAKGRLTLAGMNFTKKTFIQLIYTC